MSIDHVSIGVTNVPRSKAFYDRVLAPLGLKPIMPIDRGGQLLGVGYGEDRKPTFWIQLPVNGAPATMGNGVHVAFSAARRADVDAFYLAAIENGGIEDGRPGVREEYHPAYYGAFVRDPDGNKIEACCHQAEG